MSINVNDIVSEIWSMDDLNLEIVRDAVRGRQDQLIRQKTYSFRVNDRVYFLHNGTKMVGSIIKVNQKTCKVLTDDRGRWTVTSTLLKRC